MPSILYDSNYTPFWKRQDRKKTVKNQWLSGFSREGGRDDNGARGTFRAVKLFCMELKWSTRVMCGFVETRRANPRAHCRLRVVLMRQCRLVSYNKWTTGGRILMLGEAVCVQGRAATCCSMKETLKIRSHLFCEMESHLEMLHDLRNTHFPTLGI